MGTTECEDMNITVVGCGKMGLPLAVQAASRRHKVIGVDINKRTVDAINRGISPIDEPGIDDLLRDSVKAGRLRATTDLVQAIKVSKAIIVIVPVVLTEKREADLDAILNVARDISRTMRKGTIVSFETTLPVGTTRRRILPILEKSGKKVEKDFYLVFSPERVKSNTVLRQMKNVPKVIGGAGPASLARGLELYKSIFKSKVVPVKSMETAEMVKLAGMIYRDVNIALANEMARYSDALGIDIDEVTRLANTDGEANLLSPGVGVGGHCTPVYPYFLINDAKRKNVPQILAKSARRINDSQSAYIAGRIASLLKSLKDKRVLMLGLGFRPDVREDLYSPAYLLKNAIKKHGGEPLLYDPLYSKAEIIKKGFSYEDPEEAESLDVVVLITAHKVFSKIDWATLKAKGVKVFVDGRNYFDRSQVEKSGITYIGIGR